MIIDSHCHIHYPELLAEVDSLIANMHTNGVDLAITVCTDLDEVPLLRRLVTEHKSLYATIGVHPNTPATARCDPDELRKELQSDTNFVAVGECGLDYCRAGRSARTWQLPRLEAHVEVAMQTSLPLVVHTRDSIDDSIDALTSAVREGMAAVLHCFTGTYEQAKRALDLGFMLSFTGIVTFKNASDILDVARRMPADRMMVESDAPYLAPEPMRGKRNEPAWVRHTLSCIAAARNTTAGDLAQVTTTNACGFFNLPAPQNQPLPPD